LRSLSNPQANGLPLTFLARSAPVDGWMEVYLPTRPNGATGFVKVADLKVQQTPIHVQIEQAARRLTVWDGDRLVYTTPVAIGTEKSPTPVGTFYMQGIARLANASGPYGPFILALSAHSDVYMTFAGGDGLVGIHGTNQPSLIGSAVSHGCIRVNNDAIRHLADVVPVGAPVVIVG
jgi:lipoprotein-anchoring transpeptidase ErfK/SrfK